jgi:HlyD family secretion protein
MILVAGLAYLGWSFFRPKELPDGFARSNGRIEAVEIDIATKTAGRLVAVLVNEGDFVTAGQVLAEMDTAVLKAQLREAEAELRRAKTAVETAQSNVAQRESEKAAAESVVAQREAELDLAQSKFDRGERLVKTGTMAKEDFDTIRATLYGAKAAVSSAKANVAGSTAAIATAKSQVIEADASVGSARAKIESIQADIDDSTLRSPRDGRVQYRVAQPGEVLNAGGKVLNMIDLSDVYMTFFLPTAQAGRVSMGTEARLVFDAAPQYVVPAQVSFVADVAQFTPKTVETAEERQKLMFRIKARIDPELLKKHIRSAKTGLPGMAYVRLDPQAEWPAHLEVRLPQ